MNAAGLHHTAISTESRLGTQSSLGGFGNNHFSHWNAADAARDKQRVAWVDDELLVSNEMAYSYAATFGDLSERLSRCCLIDNTLTVASSALPMDMAARRRGVPTAIVQNDTSSALGEIAAIDSDVACQAFFLSLESSAVRPLSQAVADQFRALDDLLHEDWDGEGARALTREAIDEAERIVRSLPSGSPDPDIAPAADGSVCMEFGEGARSIWVDVGPGSFVAVLVKNKTSREERRFDVGQLNLDLYLEEKFQSLFGWKVGLRLIDIRKGHWAARFA